MRNAIRSILKTPGLSTIIVATLAVAIGANTLIFSIVNGVVLNPLPFHTASRLVAIGNEDAHEVGPVSPPDLAEWRAQMRRVDALAAYSTIPVNLTGTREPARLLAARVTANWFDLLGVTAAEGRGFAEGDDQPTAPRVAVLSHAMWVTRFGGDRGIVGRTMILDGDPYTIVGVAPTRFVFPEAPDIWVPLVFTPDDLAPTSRGRHYLTVIGRLATNTKLATASAELRAVNERITAQFPAMAANFHYAMRPLRESMVGESRTALLVLLGAVACVLLIACANVANLLLVRATARAPELALRMVLGAPRASLVRQLLAESGVLAAISGIAGMALAVWGMSIVIAARPGNIPRLEEVSLDGRVLLFTVAVVTAAAILFGLAPALYASQPEMLEQLKSGSRGVGSAQTGRLRRALVVAETALAVLLLVGAGLLTRSFARLLNVDPGFRTEHVTKLEVSLPTKQYATWARLRGFTTAVVQRLNAMPGTTSAAAGYGVPFSGGESETDVNIVGHPKSRLDLRNFADIQMVTPRYFATMGITLERGRAFTDADRAGGHQVVIVNQRFVERYLAGEDPIGKTLVAGWVMDTTGRRDSVRLGGEIVGVVANTKKSDLVTPEGPTFYLPYDQSSISYLTFVVRSTSDPAAVIAATQRVIGSVDPNVPIFSEGSLADAVRSTAARPELYAMVVGAFAVLALLLAAIGIYGVLSYSVRERRRELGIRVALGARAGQVVGLVVRQSMRLALIGLVAGLFAASLGSRFLGSLLYGVPPDDPLTYSAIGVVLLLVAALASWLPARRAAVIDPVIAMRPE